MSYIQFLRRFRFYGTLIFREKQKYVVNLFSTETATLTIAMAAFIRCTLLYHSCAEKIAIKHYNKVQSQIKITLKC